MNNPIRENVRLLIEKYFNSIPNYDDHIAINSKNLNQFLADFTEVIVARTLDAAFRARS